MTEPTATDTLAGAGTGSTAENPVAQSTETAPEPEVPTTKNESNDNSNPEAPNNEVTEKDASALMIHEDAIAQAAAAAVASVEDIQDAVQAALAVDQIKDENTTMQENTQADAGAADGTTPGDDGGLETSKKNEQRRKRYREKTVEEEATAESKPKKPYSHEDVLAARREKDRQRYASMTPEQRQIYK